MAVVIEPGRTTEKDVVTALQALLKGESPEIRIVEISDFDLTPGKQTFEIFVHEGGRQVRMFSLRINSAGTEDVWSGR